MTYPPNRPPSYDEDDRFVWFCMGIAFFVGVLSHFIFTLFTSVCR